MLASPFRVAVFLLVEQESKTNKTAIDRNATITMDFKYLFFILLIVLYPVLDYVETVHAPSLQLNSNHFKFKAICNSSNCSCAIGAGDPLITSRPALFFGKAMKSRMLSAPPNKEQRRSKPKAKPA